MSSHTLLVVLVALAGCSTGTRSGAPRDLDTFTGNTDGSSAGGGDTGSSQPGDGGGSVVYTVYAHSNTELYSVDLSAKTLVDVGPFNAPMVMGYPDTITDLAVAPDNTIYVISNTELYTADPSDGHVTSVGAVTACGSENVALTTTPDGNLYAGDFKGAFCKIDLSATPPTVTQVGTLGNNLALSGDLVAVGNGTIYGSALDTTKSSTASNNYLVTLDPTTGAVMKNIGQTGYPELYGMAYALGQVFGFTHDGSGHVVTIDPSTGVGTLFNTFNDSTGKGISFAGAGVNSMVAPTIN